MKFTNGERVRAKWPGSDKYFLGTVLDAGNKKCEIKFDEGTSYSVEVKHIYRETPLSPGRKVVRGTSERSPSRKSSVDRHVRKSSTERSARKSSTERLVRKSSTERTVRKTSSERSFRKASAERSPLKPTEASPSRNSSSVLTRISQQPAEKTQRLSRSPGRPKLTNTSKSGSTIVSAVGVGHTTPQLTSQSSKKNIDGDRSSPFVGSITHLEDRTKGLSKLGSITSWSEPNYEFSSVKSSFTTQVSARRSLRGNAAPATSTPTSKGLAASPSLMPSSRGLVQQSVLANGSFSDDDDLIGEGERVVTTSVVKEVLTESVAGRPPVESAALSAVDLLHTIRDSSVLRDSPSVEDRPRQWSVDPTSRSSASLRGSVRRSIIREVDSNSVHGSTSSRDYAELLKREGRMLAFVPLDYMEWGGTPGCAIWILLLPAILLALHLHCDQVSCDLGWRSLNAPLVWQAYLDPLAVALVLGFVAVQSVMCVLPLGYQVDLIPNTWGSPKYRCNGLLSAVVSLAVVCGAKYLGYSLTAVSSRYFQLLVASLILAIVLSVALYLRGAHAKLHSANPYVRHRGFLYSFWAGREVYPQLWHLHIKGLLYKISIVGSLVLSLVLLVEGVEWSQGQRPLGVLVSSAMLWLYLLDALWFEKASLTTFSMLYEGCGYMSAVLHCAYPFLATFTLRYHLLHRPMMSNYALVLLSLVFVVGFLLYRCSNSQKDKFRRNSLDPAIAHLETIPTSLPRARKLLVSSFWGFVRHPNYLGDIIMHFALAATCGLSLAVPYVLALCVAGMLLHRAARDGERCAHRYGSDWKRYCSTVKYTVLPYVY